MAPTTGLLHEVNGDESKESSSLYYLVLKQANRSSKIRSPQSSFSLAGGLARWVGPCRHLVVGLSQCTRSHSPFPNPTRPQRPPTTALLRGSRAKLTAFRSLGPLGEGQAEARVSAAAKVHSTASAQGCCRWRHCLPGGPAHPDLPATGLPSAPPGGAQWPGLCEGLPDASPGPHNPARATGPSRAFPPRANGGREVQRLATQFAMTESRPGPRWTLTYDCVRETTRPLH